jgi:hypothetical protein
MYVLSWRRSKHCVFINTGIVWDINQHFLLQQQHSSSSSKTTQTEREWMWERRPKFIISVIVQYISSFVHNRNLR